MFSEEESVKKHRERAYATFYFIIICFGILLARLWYLQIYRGEVFYEFSIKNTLRKEVLRAQRGFIYDRDGQLLVDNENRYDIMIIPQYLQNKEQTLEKLAAIINVDVETIEKTLRRYNTQAKFRPVRIKKNVSMEEVALIETMNQNLPGVIVETAMSRRYRDGETGAHVLGYISEMSQEQLPKYSKRDGVNYTPGDFIGQSGIEEVRDRYLRGNNGVEFVEVDARGRRTKFIDDHNLFSQIQDIPEEPGNHLELTLDRDLQNISQKYLEGKVGGIVAMDVNTGELLTMISSPSFDPSRFSKGLTTKYWNSLLNNPYQPLWGRMSQEHYSPGSTFKAITAIALMEEGLISKHTKINCTGSFQFGNRKYHCWKKQGHGYLDVVGALRESCNMFFQKMMVEFDIDILARYAKSFGLGTKTGVDIPREARGLIPTKAWKKKRNKVSWQQGETLSCAIGQSYILTSTIQLAVAYAAIANGGKVLKPQIVKSIVDEKGNTIKEFSPVVLSQSSATEDTLSVVRRGLENVMNHQKGTGFSLSDKDLKLAGKTGTSQVVQFDSSKIYTRCEEHEYDKRHHGVLVAFAPYDDPEVVVSVVTEHGCHGSYDIALVNKLVKKYLEKKRKNNVVDIK